MINRPLAYDITLINSALTELLFVRKNVCMTSVYARGLLALLENVSEYVVGVQMDVLNILAKVSTFLL